MIGIMADSHDNLPVIRKAVDFFNGEKVQMVIHAGDLISPFTASEFKNLEMPFEAVYGNNDGERAGLKTAYSDLCSLEDFKEINVAEKKIGIIHGHQDKITKALAHSGIYDVLITGHTHQSLISNINFSNHSKFSNDNYEWLNENKELNNLQIWEGLIKKTLIINPGETCGYITGKSTVVLLDIKDLKWNLIDL